LKYCIDCGKEKANTKSIRCLSCAKKGLLNPTFGKHAYNYNGGTICKSGSRKIKYLETKIKGKRKKIHRYIMEQYLGRDLLPTEIIHHINGDGLDNRIENLMLLSNVKEHKRKHKLINKGLE
jgi:hypothetical protein